MKEISIDSAASGQRFDKFLKKYFAAATSSFLYKMLRKKNIVLNGARANGSEILQDGDHVRVFFSEETFEKMRGKSDTLILFSAIKGKSYAPITILYENADILAAMKPAGLCSMPAESASDNANDRILSYLIEKGEVTEDSYMTFHPSVVNRLDRNTSGIILFGKTLRGSQMLSEQIQSRSIKKFYRCLVHGRVKEHRLLTAYWKKDSSTNTVRVSEKEFKGSKEIVTEVFPVTATDMVTLVEIELHTGRSHQIRAHMSEIGHPLLFDPKYGDAHLDRKVTEATGIRQKYQMLHCARVVLADGTTVTADVPETFSKIMNTIYL